MVKTVPENTKDGLYTCTVGYSPQLGFIRVYPMPLTNVKTWGRYQIEVERNKRDSRPESWKLSSNTRHEGFIGFEKDCIYLGDANKNQIMAKAMLSPSISRLNEERKSIGFIVSDAVNAKWYPSGRFVNGSQQSLFEDVELPEYASFTKEGSEYESRITFKDGDGLRNLQLNDWQYYEYRRKYGATKEAFRFVNNRGPMLLMLGNMHNHRNTWMVLKAIKAMPQMIAANLFDVPYPPSDIKTHQAAMP